VTLRHPDYAEATYRVGLAARQPYALAGELWLRAPSVQRVRPTLPGSTISSAGFLADGRVALTVVLPPGDEGQLWLLGSAGGVTRVGPVDVRGAITLSPDGRRVAYLAASQRSEVGERRLDEVWLAGPGLERGIRRYAFPPSRSPSEALLDLTFSPDGASLVLVSRTRQSVGATRTRPSRLDVAGGDAQELTTLPSEVVPDSYSWSPDGSRLAFLTRAGSLTSLCLVSLDGAEFRYLADLSRDDSSPLAFPPIAWSADGGRIVYSAPTQERSGPSGFLFGEKPVSGLYRVDLPRGQAARLTGAEVQSPVWRSDGTVVALSRSSHGGALSLRALDADVGARDLGELPLKPGSGYAARWDAGHAQALVATRGSGDLGAPQTDYWLVRFRPEVQP
jgi:dipeptidyl aminopeptidase/acylaminoacyl peptidase